MSDGRITEAAAPQRSTAGAPAEIQPVPIIPAAHAFWKRALDLFVSIVFLILAFPLMLLLAIVVKLTSKGPWLYKAKRIGLGAEPFHMFKFRSMYVDADKRQAELWSQNDHEGPVFKMKHDPRITPLGRFMRRYSLDELPQFFNVLTGEMSLVGPRALHDYEIAQFDDWSRERLKIKPGLTCYWQIMGRSQLSFEEWMSLDHKYIEEMSLKTDLKILMATPKAVMHGDGAY